MPKCLLKDVWLLVSSFTNPSELLVTAIFESASQEEMSFIAEDLLKKMVAIVFFSPLISLELCLNVLSTVI